MRIKVIEVVYRGQKGYLTHPDIFCQEPVTSNLMKAKNYIDDEEELKKDLELLAIPGDEITYMSALNLDAPALVKEFVMEPQEVASYIGREPKVSQKKTYKP